jgi:hypothetical protein
MKREYHYAGGIILDKINNLVLLEKAKDGQYHLPSIKVSLGENVPDQLKYDLEGEFNCKLKFLRIIPETWSRLVFSKKKANEKFNIYYLFELVSMPPRKQKQERYAWLDLKDPDFTGVKSYDVELIEML